MQFRIDEIRDAIVKNGISEAERDELLEIVHASPSRPEGSHSGEALRRLVLVLENAHAVSFPLLERSAFRDRLAFQTRMLVSPDQVASALDKARTTLAAQIEIAFSVIGPRRASRIRGQAAMLFADPPRCAARTPVRVAADLAPPPERTRACGLANALSEAWSYEAEVAALLAMHESLVTACRALALHDGTGSGSHAACPRLVAVDEKREDRLAANHPISAIVGGLAIALLLQDGAAHAPARARRWMKFGDAPLYVLELVLNGETG